MVAITLTMLYNTIHSRPFEPLLSTITKVYYHSRTWHWLRSIMWGAEDWKCLVVHPPNARSFDPHEILKRHDATSNCFTLQLFHVNLKSPVDPLTSICAHPHDLRMQRFATFRDGKTSERYVKYQALICTHLPYAPMLISRVEGNPSMMLYIAHSCHSMIDSFTMV